MHRKRMLASICALVATVGVVTAVNHVDRDRPPADAPTPSSLVPPPADPEPRQVDKGQAGVVIPQEDINPKVFIQPFDKPYLTTEERKKIFAEPGVKFIRRGGPETPFYNVGYYIHPYKVDPFVVEIKLEGAAEPGEEKLAEEAKRQFLLAKPENPGRKESFPKWQVVDPLDSKLTPLIRTGWGMQIRRIQTIPGGWRARVFVFPQARTEDYRTAIAFLNFHIEVYSFKDGKLALDSEAVDPNPVMNANNGLSCLFLR